MNEFEREQNSRWSAIVETDNLPGILFDSNLLA
jgi:hypothetical protein